MTELVEEGVAILLWSHPTGMSAYAAPWVFDLEYDKEGRATVDAFFTRLNVGDYPSAIDRYRVLTAPERARVLRAALARRDDWLRLRNDFEQYLVKHRESGIDEAEFLRVVARFIHAWRR